MALKDSLHDNAQNYTLTPDDIQFLAHINHYMQAQLTQLQEHMAATFLNHIAVTRFGYERGKDLRFHFQPEKKTDNLTITEISEA